MRRRLINSTLAVVLVVIAVFGVSLVIVETRTITSSAQDRIGSEALRLVGIVETDVLEGKPVDPVSLGEQLDVGRYARISVPGRPPVEVGERIPDSVIRGTARGEQ
ncbi:two-component sensor histidine kinase, partial [Streptomyces sp. NPDC054838]